MRKSPGSRRVALDVRQAIEEAAKDYRLRGETPNAAEILRTLRRTPKLKDRLPTERTIRSIAAEVGADAGEAWRATRSAVDVSLVLPTLARLIDHTHGARQQVTVREAELIAAIRRAAPGGDPLVAYGLALAYIAAENETILSLVELDALLAFSPWQTPEAWTRYETAALAGAVTVPARPYGMPKPEAWTNLQLASSQAQAERRKTEATPRATRKSVNLARPANTQSQSTKTAARKRARKAKR